MLASLRHGAVRCGFHQAAVGEAQPHVRSAHHQRALERAGFGAPVTRQGMEKLGFYACDRDLEDELIRAVGPPAVEELIDAAHHLAARYTAAAS